MVCGINIFGTQAIHAAKSHFSKVRYVDSAGYTIEAVGDSSTAIFDVVISLYNYPSGDDDPDNDSGTEEQTDYENIIRRWADAVYEESNGAHKLGKVRIFRNGKMSSSADVVWNDREWPRANVSGFGTSGLCITFGDIFPNGSGTSDYDMLANPEGAGYTLGHEWGHYVYGLYDEYKGKNATSSRITAPLSGDTPATPAIMNSQWKARGGNYEWLNHSTSNNYQANTAQGRAYGASCWEVLTRERSDDPREGNRSTLPARTHYTALDSAAPTAADSWVKKELPTAQTTARSSLDIIWMQDDVEMQIVIDRSGSMGGAAIANAKQAASALVDVTQAGKTALGVVSFASDVAQDYAVTAIPDPDAGVKTALKSAINGLNANGLTSMYDGAKLALDNLSAYQTAQGSSANQIVFLLSDGGDNDSVATQQSVTSQYQAADVPLVTFGYGSGAPGGILRSLAEDTGGLFFSSPTTLAEIQRAFLAANAAVTDAIGIARGSMVLDSASTVTRKIEIDSTIDSFTIVANYFGSAADVNFALKNPSGAAVAASFTASSSSGTTSVTANVDNGTILANGNGTWLLEATRTTTSTITVNLDVIGAPSNVRTYDLVVSVLGTSTVAYPNPIVLTATISKGLPITGVNLAATIQPPSGTAQSFTMNDDGADGDAVADDGVYSAIIGYQEGNGTYRVEVTVDNDAGSAQFTDAGFQPTHFFTIGEDGNMPDPPIMPVISEKFNRAAALQLTVQGFQIDDHPDFAPGTTILADNTDVAGRIDRAGDEDWFQITNIDTTATLFVRVAKLAVDMDPVMTIYEADGVTAVATADMTHSKSYNGYVYLSVQPSQLDATGTMLAKVTHADATADEGNYEISAGAAVISDTAAQPTAGKPIVTTGNAKSITDDSAVLNGTVNPNGSETTVYFEYGRDTSYGWRTGDANAGSGTLSVPVMSTPVTGLLPNTTYHFRLVANNSNGNSNGQDQTFTTSPSNSNGGGGGGGGCFISAVTAP
jgi:uncharacterized protein YegL